jgi:predicted transcriptional regulator
MEKIASLQSTNIQSNNNNNEHKRQLLLGILRQRGIIFDSQTGKIIDDKASIETLLRVLQNEKQKKK